MKGYVIKVTYLTGRHKGKTYLMKKGGYVTEEHFHHFESDVYKTLGVAKRVCTMYRNNNERDYNCERNYNNYKIAKGGEGKEWFIYELESYEPFEIEYSKDII